MFISELQKYLSSVSDMHGDIEIIINDTETGWIFKLNPDTLFAKVSRDIVRLEIVLGLEAEELVESN